MKQGNALVKFVMMLLAAALVCYMGFYVWNSLTTPFTTTYAYHYTVHDGVQTQGWLARKESVLPPQAGIVDLTRGEAEKVGVGQTIALVHRDSRAVAAQEELNQLAGEIALLDYAMGQGDSSVSTAKLDETILQSLVALRSKASRQDFTQLEDQTLAVKSLVLKRNASYGQTLDPALLAARRQELATQYQELKNQSNGATTRIQATESGVFSALVDGYETLLTPSAILSMTPTQLDQLKGAHVDGGNSPGKLITSQKWSFVTALGQDYASRLKIGQTVTLGFTGDFNQEVSMLVEHIGEGENGRHTVVFSSDQFLSRTTLLRAQSAELIYASYTGLRVPKTALRMVEQTVTDPESKESKTVNVMGVYAIVGGRAEFKPAKVVTEGSDYYVIAPDSQGGRALRAGDKIIVRATDLYDGKLLEY